MYADGIKQLSLRKQCSSAISSARRVCFDKVMTHQACAVLLHTVYLCMPTPSNLKDTIMLVEQSRYILTQGVPEARGI